jgi:hypothetical protein
MYSRYLVNIASCVYTTAHCKAYGGCLLPPVHALQPSIWRPSHGDKTFVSGVEEMSLINVNLLTLRLLQILIKAAKYDDGRT